MKNRVIPPPVGMAKKKIQPPLPNRALNPTPIHQQPVSIDEPEAQRPQKIINITNTEPQTKEEISVQAQRIQQVTVTQNLDDSKFEQPKKEEKMESSFVAPPAPRKGLPVPVRPPVNQIKKQVRPNFPQPKIINREQNDPKVEQATNNQPNFEEKKEEQQSLMEKEPSIQPQPLKKEIKQVEQVKPQQLKEPQITIKANQVNQSFQPLKTPINIPPKNAPKLPVNIKKGPAVPPKIAKPIPLVKPNITLPQRQEVEQPQPQEQTPKQTPQAIVKPQKPLEISKIQPKAQASKVPKPQSPKNIKSEIITPKQPKPQKINQPSVFLPPTQPVSGVKNKMSQKLQQLRRAKQQMLVDQSFCQQEQEEEQQQEQEEEEEKDLEKKEVKYDRPDSIKEQIVKQKQEIKQQTPQKIIEPPSNIIVAQKTQPTVVQKAPVVPNKSLSRQPPAPNIKKIAPPQFQKVVKVQQVQKPPQFTRVEKTQEILPPPQFERVIKIQQKPQEPNEIKQTIVEKIPQPPIISEISKNNQPEIIQVAEKKNEIKIKVKIQQPKPNNEINKLLERYTGLKNGYLNNLRELDELIHFQKQQQQAEIQKINHLLSELHNKNQAIKQLCSAKYIEQPYQNQEIAI